MAVCMGPSQSTLIFSKVEEELNNAKRTWDKLQTSQQKESQVYEDEIKDLKKKLKDTEQLSERKIKLLKKELLRRKKLLDDLAKAKDKTAIDREEHHKLQEECLKLNKQFDEKSRLLQCYKDRIKIFEEIIEKIQKKHSFAMKDEQARQRGLRHKLQRIKTKLDEKKQDTNKATEVEELNLKIASLQNEIGLLKDKNSSLLTERDKSRDWKKEVEMLTEKNKKLENSQRELEQKNQDYREKIKILEEKRSTNEGTTTRKENLKYLSQSIAELERKNAAMKEELEKSEKKYQNVLILPGGHQELLALNERLKNRIDVIEENFDEAWAGFRLEILRYEKSLEKMEDCVETMKAEKEGKVYKRTKPRFEKTDSGAFCLLAMEELQELLQFGERSPEYLSALKELQFYASSVHKQNTPQKYEDYEEKDESSGADNNEEKIAQHKGNNAEEKMNEGDEQKKAGFNENASQATTNEEKHKEREQKQEFSYEDDFEQDSDDEEEPDKTESDISQKATGSCHDKDCDKDDAESEKSINSIDSLPMDSALPDKRKTTINETVTDEPKSDDNDTDDGKDEENECVTEDIVSEEEMTNTNDDEMIIPDPVSVVIVGVCHHPNLISILKSVWEKKSLKTATTTTKRSVKFNNIVEFQFIDNNNTVSENGDFVDILKAPQEKWEIPKVSILDAPRTTSDTVIPSSFKFPTLRNIPPPVESNNNNDGKERITAADIFGNVPGKYEDNNDDADDNDEFDTGNLDDAIDFILNM